MSDEHNKPTDMGQVMHSIGQLTGAVGGRQGHLEAVRNSFQAIINGNASHTNLKTFKLDQTREQGGMANALNTATQAG